MKISIILKDSADGTSQYPKLKCYVDNKEWATWGKPRAFTASGTLRDGLTFTWTQPGTEGARKWSVHNNAKNLQAEISGAFIPASRDASILRATIAPTAIRILEQTKSGVKFYPIALSELPLKPEGAPKRRKGIRGGMPMKVPGQKPNGHISLDKLRAAVETINQGLPENAILELTDGSRRLRIMLEII